MSSTNPHETARRARKVARLVQIITAASPEATPVSRFGSATRMTELAWSQAALLVGSRPPSARTRHDVLMEFAKSATLDLAAAARLRGEGGLFETLAIGSERAGLGLDHDAWLIVQEAHRELVAEAERIRGAA